MAHRTTAPSLFADVPTATDTPTKTPKDTGWVTAHCDGGARGNPGPAGYGAVLTGPNGQPLAELSEFLGIRTNNYAEYSGLLGVLAYALEHNYHRLKVISDSELMVKQIQGKYKVSSPDLKPMWQEAKSRIARLEAFEISHALRHKNKEADRLANLAMDRGVKRPHASGQPAPEPLKATPYPTKSTTPPDPDARRKPLGMLRGFTRDGVVHILGSTTLPDGIFVKIIPE
jgi:ribonuclease HI